jgi:hypothetical protein
MQSCWPANLAEVQMTLQIGFVGTDGIVLASDRKKVFFDPVQHSSSVSKFICSKDIAIACAGYEIGELVARKMLSDTSSLPFFRAEQLAAEVYEQHAQNLKANSDSQLLAVSLKDLNAIYNLQIIGGTPRSNRCRDKAYGGHLMNSGLFFSERFYERKPISQLVFLAAHTILMAAKLNPRDIEGLEIVTCTESGIAHLPESQIAELVARSNDLDTELRSLMK